MMSHTDHYSGYDEDHECLWIIMDNEVHNANVIYAWEFSWRKAIQVHTLWVASKPARP